MNCDGQGRQFAACPLARPLLAAFATIAAMIKCFNSIKIVIIAGMTTTAPQTPSVQLLEVSPEYAGQRIDNFLLARLKGVPKTQCRTAC